MNIFMTGLTTMHTNQGKIKKRSSRIDLPPGLVRVLREGGHNVEWRNLPVGDPLPEADVVWVTMAPPASFNAPFALDGTWAIHEALRLERPLVLYFDDWQFQQVFAGYKVFVGRGIKQVTAQTKTRYMYYGDITKAVEHIDDLMDTSQRIMEGSVFEHAIAAVPKFTNWGDMGIIESKMPTSPHVWTVDPTPLMADTLAAFRPIAKPKKRAWTLAAIMNHTNWLDKLQLQWPVTHVGPRAVDTPRIDELGVLNLCAQNWGVLAPIYPHTGSGWWRTRFVYAAVAESVLYCGAGDAAALSTWYDYTTSAIEALDDRLLAAVAYRQRQVIMPLLVMDENVLYNQLVAVCNAAITEKANAAIV